MASVNKVILVGRLGRDPESKSFQNGGSVVNLRIATSEKWKDKHSGEQKEKTEWHAVSIFNEGIGKVAEKYLRKGSQCYIEGQLQTRKWQDSSGADRYSTEIVLQGFNAKLVLLDGVNNDRGDSGGTRGGDDGGMGSRGDRGGSSGFGRSDGGGYGGGFGHDLDDDVPF